MKTGAVRRLILLPLALAACSASHHEDRPFFRTEYGTETHGRKTWFDHLVEVDPGGIKVTTAPDYEDAAPEKIAVLPFTDRGSAQYVVDKIPLSFRNQDARKDWAWTYAQRLRRALVGHLAQREFVPLNLIEIDAVLYAHGIDNFAKLKEVPPQQLGQWLGVDAVVYGEVEHYDAYYAFLVAAWQVGMKVSIVSTRDGHELISARGSRFAVDLRPAFELEDIAMNSALALLQLRDVTLARAEEEISREFVKRIPESPKLIAQLVREGRQRDLENEMQRSNHVAQAAVQGSDASGPVPANNSVAQPAGKPYSIYPAAVVPAGVSPASLGTRQNGTPRPPLN